jgi:flagellar transcriptional activator FlhD
MNVAGLYAEIKELNLAYLMLAQQMLRSDREGAMFRLGVNSDIAEVIDGLTPGQLLKMAGSNMLLCQFRFDDTLLLKLLGNHDRDTATSHLHAAILAAGKPVEALA